MFWKIYHYSFRLCSVEKSKFGNNLFMSLSISMGKNTFGGVHSLETHNFSFLISLYYMIFYYSILLIIKTLLMQFKHKVIQYDSNQKKTYIFRVRFYLKSNNKYWNLMYF